MDTGIATQIAKLNWIARLFKWQIATMLIIGVLSIALGASAVYSYYGGQKCHSEVFQNNPLPTGLIEKLAASKTITTGPTDPTHHDELLEQYVEDLAEQYAEATAKCMEQWWAWRWVFSMDRPNTARLCPS
jgi:hypothetical protein